ncbi:hypothetical protein PAEPH01_2350 [Pancytospora epiphaga]|nr:hypothetical protein PAEPH01_2350 [Pancytospora epiphaga]
MVQIFYKNECDIVRFLRDYFKDNTELVFVVGGDGTYLKALSEYKLGTAPTIYAFNTGTIGALIPIPSFHILELADKIHRKELSYVDRTRLYVRSHGICVSNDLIIYSKAHSLAQFNIYVNKENIEIRGDGITIATRSGSTGHSYSIGGPVLLTEGIILNCSAPNRCNFRPLVFPLNTKIRIETFGCIGVFDNHLSVESDIFEIDGWDSYKVAVCEPFEELSVAKRLFTIT